MLESGCGSAGVVSGLPDGVAIILKLFNITKLAKYRVIRNVVRVLTTCHTQYTSDRSIYIFLFNITML